MVESYLPLTAEIIMSKNRYFDNLAVAYCPSIVTSSGAMTVTSKRVEDSWLELILPFSDQPALRQSMVGISVIKKTR